MRTVAKFADFSRSVFKGIAKTGILAFGFVSLLFASAPVISMTNTNIDDSIAHADIPSCGQDACGCSCDGGSAGDAGDGCGGCGGCSSGG